MFRIKTHAVHCTIYRVEYVLVKMTNWYSKMTHAKLNMTNAIVKRTNHNTYRNEKTKPTVLVGLILSQRMTN